MRSSTYTCLTQRHNQIHYFITEGPCLVHTLNGDLLRSLEAPDGCITPEIISVSREAFVLVKFDQGQICNYSINGRLLQRVSHKDNIQVIPLCSGEKGQSQR